MTRHSAGNVERVRCCRAYEEGREGVVGVGGGDELVDIVVLRGRGDCFELVGGFCSEAARSETVRASTVRGEEGGM